MLKLRDNEAVKGTFKSIVEDAVEKVNTTFKLRRSLGCDVQFGDNYSQIH